MGHARLDNLDKILLRQVYAKGKVSIAELAQHAKKLGEGLCASEGIYNSDGEYDHTYGIVREGFEWCIRNHLNNHILLPIIETDLQQDIFDDWELADDSWSEDFLEILHSIKWRFDKGARKKYLDKTIKILYDVTN